ncbi:MAG: hypothetical protein K8S97_03605 [Anaerolineae bacterium]|nr:hypothetical protein [Anaerolineae bacterium]
MKILFRSSLILILCVVFVGGVWFTAPPDTEARGASWSTTVYSNPDLIGTPVWQGVTPSVGFTWGAGQPVINGVVTTTAMDNFSIRFTTSSFFTAGTYRFTVQVDDGARLYVDGLLLINGWVGGMGLQTRQADYTFVGDGSHTITVEMFEQVGDATIIASWAVAVGPTITCQEGYSYTTCPSGGVFGGTAPSGCRPVVALMLFATMVGIHVR